jgi:hypothetical protein
MICPFQSVKEEGIYQNVRCKGKECALFCMVGSCCSFFYMRDLATELYEIRRELKVLRATGFQTP